MSEQELILKPFLTSTGNLEWESESGNVNKSLIMIMRVIHVLWLFTFQLPTLREQVEI